MIILEKIHTVPTSEELINKAFKRAAKAISVKNIKRISIIGYGLTSP